MNRQSLPLEATFNFDQNLTTNNNRDDSVVVILKVDSETFKHNRMLNKVDEHDMLEEDIYRSSALNSSGRKLTLDDQDYSGARAHTPNDTQKYNEDHLSVPNRFNNFYQSS